MLKDLDASANCVKNCRIAERFYESASRSYCHGLLGIRRCLFSGTIVNHPLNLNWNWNYFLNLFCKISPDYFINDRKLMT